MIHVEDQTPVRILRVAHGKVRHPTLVRIETLRPLIDPDVHRIWASADTRARVRTYLEATIGRAG